MGIGSGRECGGEFYHVLAVDDSLIDRKIIERLLKTSSFQVTTADSGSRALELLGLHHQEEVEVNLIITDYCMPGMTGYDLLKKIKESSSLRDIPVVIMSSENVPSRINRCLEGGAEEFLLKPVKLSDVNRLRPHILKGKNKHQHHQEQHQQEQEQHSKNGNSNKKRKAAAMDEEEDVSPPAESSRRKRQRLSNGGSGGSSSSLTTVL